MFDRPDIDFVIVADRAEAINGKLYMMGGGWDQVAVVDFARPVPFTIAVGIAIPWNATNQDHRLQVAVADEDGTRIFGVDGGFKVGRPPQLPQGANQRTILAIPVAAVLNGPGSYTVEATVNDEARRTTSFAATQAPPPSRSPRALGLG
jgi:hypothetical protein